MKSLGWFIGGWKICCQSSRFMLLYHIIQRKKKTKNNEKHFGTFEFRA